MIMADFKYFSRCINARFNIFYIRYFLSLDFLNSMKVLEFEMSFQGHLKLHENDENENFSLKLELTP